MMHAGTTTGPTFPITAPAPPGPPEPPPPELALTFGGIAHDMVAPLAYHPGRQNFADHGRSAIEARALPGITLTWTSNQPNTGAIGRDEIADATSAAEAEFAALRHAFRSHRLYVRWREIVGRLSDLKARTSEIEAAPAAALREARQAIVRGEDPAAAETRHEAALREITLHGNRVEATTAAESQARIAAQQELARQLEDLRAKLHDAAANEAQRLADEIDQAVQRRFLKLLAAHTLAGRLSPTATTAARFGASQRIEQGGYHELP